MRHWTQLGAAPIPGTDKALMLFESKDDFHIKLSGGFELMSTRKHGSEDALGRLPCEHLADSSDAQVLIGGLGMGFTLAAVLAVVGDAARVTVAELIPEVVEWNRGPLGAHSGHPLDDPRTQVEIADVCTLLRQSRPQYDVIALDTDNGPEGLTQSSNNWLYSDAGITATSRALRPGGVLAYWSAGQDAAFRARLKRNGLSVREHSVYAHGTKGTRHTVWLAQPQRRKPKA